MALVAFVISLFAIGSAKVLGALEPRCYTLTEGGVVIFECY